MKKLLLLALFAPVISYAGDNTPVISWTNPTTYVGGAVMNDFKETLIEWRVRGTTVTAGSIRIASPATTSGGAINLGCVRTATTFDFAVSAVTTGGERSDPVVLPYLVDTFSGACKPNPPSAVTVQ